MKCGKLDKKAIPSIFVCYSSVYKSYKVYHSQTGKMTIIKDVHFNEEDQWDSKNLQRTFKFSQDPRDSNPQKQKTY